MLRFGSRSSQLFFVALSERPDLNRGVGPLLRGFIRGERAALENDDRAPLRSAAAMSIVEVHKQKTGE
jgi:hypothetical protein